MILSVVGNGHIIKGALKIRKWCAIKRMIFVILFGTIASCIGSPKTFPENSIHPDNSILLKQILSQKNNAYVLIDARSTDEYLQGHIPTAIHLQSMDQIKKQLVDKEVKIIIYCSRGVRSSRAGNRLLQMGYPYIYNFGGIGKWDGEIIQGVDPGLYSVAP